MTVLTRSLLLVFSTQQPTAGIAVAGIMGVLSGALLVIGFFTVLASLVVGVFCACALAFALPGGPMFDSQVAAFLAGAIGFAIVLLGPGAFSADARLFGPREIIIPATTGPRRRGGN